MPNVDVEPAESRLQHTATIWAVLFVALIGFFAVTVVTLNSTLYSAGGFVSSYLQALQRGDLDEVFSTSGVIKTAGVSTDLLQPAVLGSIDDFTITSDIDQGSGVHMVSYRATLNGMPAAGAFEVLRGENNFGVFSTWAFLQSPISELWITPLHEDSFSVNGHALTSVNGPSVATSYQVLTPGAFTLTHDSTYLTATPVSTTVTRAASTVPLILDIQAAPSFVSGIQEQVNEFLDDCTTQEVLFPTGCPFGQAISNVVVSAPEWKISRYPEVLIVPGNDPGTWLVPEAAAEAHLTVDVRSLFDGTVSVFDEDVPFGVSWVMTILEDRIDIQQQ